MAIMKRGAGPHRERHHFDELIFLVKDAVLDEHYLLEGNGTVSELFEELGDMYKAAVYKGACLGRSVVLQKLNGRQLQLYGTELPLLPSLRRHEEALASRLLHLVEISERYIGRDIRHSDEHTRHLLDDILAKLMLTADGMFTRQVWTRLRQRGGAGKGKLAWESTQTIKGVRSITEFKVDGHKIEHLSSDLVCENAKGISFCLMSQWPRLADISSQSPLMLIFLGRCTAALKKLQVAPTKVAEDEIVIQDADATTMTRRHVTMLRLSEHNWEIGSNFKAINWAPNAAVEVILEMDSRWMMPSTIREAQRSWRELAANCASKMALTSIPAADVYGAKPV